MKRIITILVLLVAAASAATAQASSHRYCGLATNGLAVHAVGPTSCSFAKATANTYLAQRHGTVRVYSRVTHRSYTMHCSFPSDGEGETYLLCTGANHARVEVRP